MQRIIQLLKSRADALTKILPILAFAMPLVILYSLYPTSFEATWKGRTYYLFFIWIVFLETILSWENIQAKNHKLRSVRTLILAVALALPTLYVIAANYWGLNAMIVALSPKHFGNTFWAELMPLSVEYLVFAVLFTLIVVLAYGIAGLKNLAIATAFLGAIGTIYIIDNLYPEGQFTPFQIIVPTTTTLASSFLNLIGYRTYIDAKTTTPLLVASNAKGTFGARIAWPCSGVESLVIYAITILLFLRNSSIKWPYKIVYFLIGAIVTYFINILRIATIFVIAIDTGGWSYQAQRFHDYYGMLYSIIWILSYPLIIIGSRALWGRIRGNKARQDGNLPTYASSST